MPQFAYTALDAHGKTVNGEVSVRNRAEAYHELERQALHPVTLREVAERAARRGRESEAETGPVVLTRAQLIAFTEELADMLDAGLQVEQALRVIEERQESEKVRRLSRQLREDIREGTKLSAALKKATPSVDELYVNLVAAGEAGGSLGEILKRLASNLQILHELRSRLIGALIYPMFLVGACVVLLFVFGTVLMPQLTDLITIGNRDLSLITRMLVAFSDFMGQWWWALILGVTIAVLAFRGYVRTPKGRRWWDEATLRIPLIGPVLSAHYYAQFCQALGNLVSNGVPLLNGLKLMGRATQNGFHREKLSGAIDLVSEGAGVSSSMRRVGGFPPLLIDMLGVGEQTGRLGQSLAKAAQRYDRELSLRIDRLTKMISPIVLIVMAVIVGVVAYAIISTLFQSATGIRGPR